MTLLFKNYRIPYKFSSNTLLLVLVVLISPSLQPPFSFPPPTQADSPQGISLDLRKVENGVARYTLVTWTVGPLYILELVVLTQRSLVGQSINLTRRTAHFTYMLYLTSKDAADRGDNVFIWRTKPSSNLIVLSWRVDKDLPMTHKSLYQWVDEVIQNLYTPFGPHIPLYSIFPVEVTRGENMPLTHITKRAVESKSGLPAPPLSPDSLELLKPGNYGLFKPNGEVSRDSFQFRPKGSIYLYKIDEDYGEDFADQSVISDELRCKIKARDGRKCCLTQMEFPESDIDITYIIPPWLAYLTLDHNDEIRRDMAFEHPTMTPQDVAETAMVSGNCLTMSKTAILLFEKSIITIDVDDNYRIIRFYKGDWVNSEIGRPLPEYFTPNGTEADIFLRAHFQYSLSVHAYGGDHQDTVPLDLVKHFMLDVGLFEEDGVEFSLKDDDYSTGEWNTYIGRQVLAWFQERSYEPWGNTSTAQFGLDDD